ncbi:MAG: hypothetical protein NTZ67_03505 [Gammaproteobacteria bacterium]|nr:hypothetical protein [Gammaproteobacteria bacterium]
MKNPKIDIAFIRWSWMRAVLHQGWWLVTSLCVGAQSRAHDKHIYF